MLPINYYIRYAIGNDMCDPEFIRRVKKKLVLNDKDIQLLAEHTERRFFGRVERG